MEIADCTDTIKWNLHLIVSVEEEARDGILMRGDCTSLANYTKGAMIPK